MKTDRVMRGSKQLFLFILGGLLYNLIEIIWRGRTHWSMFIVGGACFRVIGCIYRTGRRLTLAVRCILSAAAVTTIEFVSGCLFNLRLQMRVWDYAGMPLNIAGQVCLLYSFLWGILSIPAGWLHRRCERGWSQLFLPSADGHK